MLSPSRPSGEIRIQLKNFRKFRDMNYTIATSVVKIAGDSGAGKSSLLDSIIWCFYGKIQKVKPRDGSGPTEVTIEIPYKEDTITIRRRSKVDVSVWLGEEVYEGDRAQGIINDYFGTNDAFMLTSFLPAESMHKFISATPSEKKEITHLLFPDICQYDKYSLKLKEKRKEEEKSMELQCRERAILSSSMEALTSNHSWLSDYTGESQTDDIHVHLQEYGLPSTPMPTHMDIQRMTGSFSSILGRYETLSDECVRPEHLDIEGIESQITAIEEKLSLASTGYLDVQSKIANSSTLLSKYNMLIERDLLPEYLDVEELQATVEGIDTGIEEEGKSIEAEWSMVSDSPLVIQGVQRYVRECYSILGRCDTLKSQQIDEPTLDVETVTSRVNSIKEEIVSSRVSSESKESKLAYLNGCLESHVSSYDEECLKDLDLTRRLHALCPSYEDSVRSSLDLNIKVRDTECLLMEYEESMEAMDYNARLLDILECPQCKARLRYTDTLHEVDHDTQAKKVVHNITKVEIENLRVVLSGYRKSHLEITTKVNEYDKVVSNNPHIGVPLKFHGSPAKYNRYIVEMKSKKEKIDSLSLEIESISSDTCKYLSSSEMEILSRESVDLENKLSSYRTDTLKYQTIKSQLEKIEVENPWVERGVSHITDIEKILSDMQQLERRKYASEGERHSLLSKISGYKAAMSKYDSIRGQLDTMLSSSPWLVEGEEYICVLQKELDDAVQCHADNDSLKRELSTLRSSLSSYNDSMSRYSTIVSKMEHLVSKNEWIPKGRKYVEDLQSLSVKIVEYSKRTEMRKIYQSYSSYKGSLEEVMVAIDRCVSRLDVMVRLNSLLDEAYRRYVDNKMKEIEYDISLLGKLFFDESMNITIVGDKGDKPSFDIMVEHEGVVHDDVRAMSTGERKRLSIIMMIVLSKYMDTKIIMLDEAFSSIGMDSRGVVLGELGKMGITCLLTSHDSIPGGYYDILDLD